MSRYLLAGLVLGALALPVHAMSLKDLKPGAHVSGPNLSVEEMAGKVVIVMYWGTR